MLPSSHIIIVLETRATGAKASAICVQPCIILNSVCPVSCADKCLPRLLIHREGLLVSLVSRGQLQVYWGECVQEGM